MNMANGGIGLPIETFPKRFSPVLRHVAKRCHVAKSLCHVSARITTVFSSILGSNASIAVDSDLP